MKRSGFCLFSLEQRSFSFATWPYHYRICVEYGKFQRQEKMKYPRRRGDLTQQRISAWKGSLQFSLIHLLSFLNLEQQQARISVPGTVWVAKYRALLETKTLEFPMLEWLRKCRKKIGSPKIESRLVGVQQWQLQRQGNVSWPWKVFDDTKFWCSSLLYLTTFFHFSDTRANEPVLCQLWYN